MVRVLSIGRVLRIPQPATESGIFFGQKKARSTRASGETTVVLRHDGLHAQSGEGMPQKVDNGRVLCGCANVQRGQCKESDDSDSKLCHDVSPSSRSLFGVAESSD